MGTTCSISGVPRVSVPVLSRITVRASPSCSIAAPPLTMMPSAGSARDSRKNGDGRGEDERAGRRDDEHGQPADRIPAEHPGQPGRDQGDGQEEGRVAIGHADERRLVALGLAHETDDGRVRAFGCRSRRPQLERVAGVRRSAADRRSLLVRNRQRFARERRLVENRLSAQHQPVDGNDLALPHQT